MVLTNDKKELKDLISKRIKIFYNDLTDNVTLDVGILENIDNGFLIVNLNNKNKYISLTKVVRIEEEIV